MVLCAFGLAWLAACGSEPPRAETVDPATTTVDLRYVIPSGTAARLARGERVDILPSPLTAHVGEVIQIVNEDDEGQVLGPFYVAPRSTMTQRFASAGRFVGSCAVHPSGEIELDVTA